MALTVELSTARSWNDEHMQALFAEGFPEFIVADREVEKYIARIRERFTHLDLMLVDEHEVPVATGWGVPIAWSGTTEDLPATFAQILSRALDVHDTNGEANTLVIGGAVVHPGSKGSGAASELLNALRRLARQYGLSRVLAPVRPTRKHFYPLTSMDEYVSWVRDDGLPLDPWLRLHVRLGGRILAVAPHAQTMTGTVAQWETWVNMRLPASGEYVISQGMSLLHIDLASDLGTYVEDNVWVHHESEST